MNELELYMEARNEGRLAEREHIIELLVKMGECYGKTSHNYETCLCEEIEMIKRDASK